MKSCPQCDNSETLPAGSQHKVIFMGFPMMLCDCDNVLYGFWSFIHSMFMFITTEDNEWAFFEYTGHNYWNALRYWLTA